APRTPPAYSENDNHALGAVGTRPTRQSGDQAPFLPVRAAHRGADEKSPRWRQMTLRIIRWRGSSGGSRDGTSGPSRVSARQHVQEGGGGSVTARAKTSRTVLCGVHSRIPLRRAFPYPFAACIPVSLC